MKAKLEKKEGSNMKVTEIEIHAGDVDHPYRTVAKISAKVEAATLFPKTPTLEDVNFKLQEKVRNWEQTRSSKWNTTEARCRRVVLLLS